jgi:hypothetical protein
MEWWSDTDLVDSWSFSFVVTKPIPPNKRVGVGVHLINVTSFYVGDLGQQSCEVLPVQISGIDGSW